MRAPDLGPVRWTRSSFSTSQANCVEVAAGPGTIAVRDSKDPDGPALVLPAGHWSAFLRAPFVH